MASLPVSPLAPSEFPTMQPVPGIEFGAVGAGLKYKGRPDLLMVVFPEGTATAGVFTKSKMPAAPVDWSKAALQATEGHARCLIVNSGNANAFTGAKGALAAEKTAQVAAEIVGCESYEVLLASTGVIGEPLDVSSFPKYLSLIHDGLSASLWKDAATAITTTDTFPKGCSKVADVGGKTVVISGISKGSGMIAPDMATMLGFVFTNAPVTSTCLQTILSQATEKSFNATTVDGDTSTNDTVFAFAASGTKDLIDDPRDPRLDGFKAQFAALMIDLAQQVVRDGEGATKFISITVDGAEDDVAAKNIALTIANSPLVKTAVAGEDANWGRIVMAIGKSGEAADRDKLQITIGDQLVAKDGMVVSSYSEELSAAYMKNAEIDIQTHVGVGGGSATVWTCDLTHGYISINADYRS